MDYLSNKRNEFAEVYSIISTHRNKVVRVVNNESMLMVWEVGGYVATKLSTSVWGEGVVRQLAEYIHSQDPAARGWSYRTIYKMVQFYETYTTESFSTLLTNLNLKEEKQVVPFETAQNGQSIVPFQMAQIPEVLFSTGWTNHQIILNRCETDAERLFYILYAGRERLQNKELTRAIELKTSEFHPKDLGQLEFYLEALDQEERRSNENPTIGILLCKEADKEVVRYALNRSMSPTMVARYEEQLKVGGVIQRSLVEFCQFIQNNKGIK